MNTQEYYLGLETKEGHIVPLLVFGSESAAETLDGVMRSVGR
jgi:hypothetical protein